MPDRIAGGRATCAETVCARTAVPPTSGRAPPRPTPASGRHSPARTPPGVWTAIAPRIRYPRRARTSIVGARHLDPQFTPPVVARAVLGRVPDQILVGQVGDDVVGRPGRARRGPRRTRARRSSRPGARGSRRRLSTSVARPWPMAYTTASLVSRRPSVASSGALLWRSSPSEKTHQRPPSRLLAEFTGGLDDDVVERGAAPGPEPVDGPEPGRQVAPWAAPA